MPDEGETFEEHFGSIWDYRDDPEGMLFGDDVLKTDEAITQADAIEALRLSKAAYRLCTLGFEVQPIGKAKP